MSKLTALHINIIGFVVSIILSAVLYFALVKPLNEEIESTNLLWKTHSAGFARKLECGETMEPAINPVSMICGTPLQSIASLLGIAETRMCNISCPNCPFTLGTFIWRQPKFISP